MDWDNGRPPPEGWQRATIWDSLGFWRLDLGSGPRAGLEPPEVSAAGHSRLAAGTPTGGPWWKTSGDPDAMLDLLLKLDDASWRKVVLWGCACLRRFWPRLATEPIRRAVEAAERFADGRATDREAGNAAGTAAAVRKGDRRANRAALLLARLCSASRPFPPGDVSNAVAEAVACDPDARAAERKAHAELLREVFGDPFRPVPVDPDWLTSTVVALAGAAYQESERHTGQLDPARLAVLADALEEAGCTDAELLQHLRGPGPHMRGCWAVDLLLDRE
jgi:hypothetical protein